MSLRVLIVDDEPAARERLRQLLRMESDVDIVGECADGREAISIIRKESPDLVFLDVRMPELDGFETLRALSSSLLPVIVFVTAYDQYALRAFEIGAADYLLKPFDREQFSRALRRARARIDQQKTNKTVQDICVLLTGLNTRPKPIKRLVVKSAERVALVEVREIDWISGADNYVELHVGKTVHLLRQTLASLEQQLPGERFFRINRSIIVNRERIKELRPVVRGYYQVVLCDGTGLSASRNYRETIRHLLGKVS